MTATPSRAAYLVGTMPGRDAPEAITTALRYLGPALSQVSDGETGDRRNWIELEIMRAMQLSGLTNLNPEVGFTGYDDLPWFRPDRRLTAEDFGPVLTLESAFTESYPVFTELRSRWNLPGLRLQASVPAPLDLGLYMFHEQGLGPEIQDPITEAKARQVRACYTLAGADAAYQLESVAAVKMVADSPDRAKYAAALLTDLPSRCPGTAWAFHPCYGDWRHEAMTRPGSALPLVQLCAEVTAQWPAAATLRWLHLPLAAASEPPSLDPAWYEPLGALRDHLPPGCQVAAGFVHELLSLGQLRDLQEIIEVAYGGEMAVAPACGLGRRPDPRQPFDILEKMAALAGLE